MKMIFIFVVTTTIYFNHSAMSETHDKKNDSKLQPPDLYSQMKLQQTSASTVVSLESNSKTKAT